eukprot:1192611-Prorocentrum_minimum.AAC.3
METPTILSVSRVGSNPYAHEYQEPRLAPESRRYRSPSLQRRGSPASQGPPPRTHLAAVERLHRDGHQARGAVALQPVRATANQAHPKAAAAAAATWRGRALARRLRQCPGAAAGAFRSRASFRAMPGSAVDFGRRGSRRREARGASPIPVKRTWLSLVFALGLDVVVSR